MGMPKIQVKSGQGSFAELPGAGFEPQPRPFPFLREVKWRIDWDAIRQLLLPAYHAEGRPGIDPVLMVRLWLLQRWFNLSDRAVIDHAMDRASFREFLELGAEDLLPDPTTLYVFRERLTRCGLEDEPLVEVDRQLIQHGLIVQTRNSVLVDGSLIPSATRSTTTDSEGQPLEPEATTLAGKKGKPPTHGWKMHAAVAEDSELILGITVTTATGAEREQLDKLIMEGDAELLADRGYPSKGVDKLLRARKVKNRVMRKKPKGGTLNKYNKQRNKAIAKRRGCIEHVFAYFKDVMGWRRAAFRGLTKVTRELLWSVTAYNLRRLHSLGWRATRAGP